MMRPHWNIGRPFARRVAASLAGTLLVIGSAGLASAQVPAGAPFRVNVSTSSPPFTNNFPAVALDGNGDFVVVWNQVIPQPNITEVRARRYSASGIPRGGEFQVNTYTFYNQLVSSKGTPLVMAPNGDFLVAWASNFQDGDQNGVFAQRFRRDGSVLGPEWQVNENTIGSAYYAAVARAPDGSFVVVWENGSSPSYDVFGRRYDASANPLGGEFRVNSYTPGSQRMPDVAVAASGRFVVVWRDYSGLDGSGRGVFGRRFEADGTPIGDDFRVSAGTVGDQGLNGIASAADGRFVVTWHEDLPTFDDDLFIRLFDANGAPVGAQLLIDHDNLTHRSAVAMEANGDFVLVWGGDLPPLRGQRFRSTGVPRGAEFAVGGEDGEHPEVALDCHGNFVVSWTDYPYGGNQGMIFARRYGGLVPATLAVDSRALGGNGVLEPGESVDVRPGWRNVNGAAQSFQGALANPAGPGSPLIQDGAADYGSVADGTAQTCLDCYRVSVADPQPRPIQHWDITVDESLTPDALGQRKTWNVHVGRSFVDVPPSSPFYHFVERVLHRGALTPCANGMFCLDEPVSRGELARAVLVAANGRDYVPPSCDRAAFSDVSALDASCPWINELARRGAVAGCGEDRFCGDAPVSREELALVALRVLEPDLAPPDCTGEATFGDVDASSPFCPWIEELARRGVVTGCGGGNYCAQAPVTRAQMAVFLAATFGLAVHGP